MAKGIRLLLGCLLITLVVGLPATVFAGLPSKAVAEVRGGMNPFLVVYCRDGATLRGSKSGGYRVTVPPYGNECRLR